MRRLPFSSVDGRSGGDLETIETDFGRYVLKRISYDRDLTMWMTGDRQGRAVKIWRDGLLDRLPPQVTHGMVGCARDGDGWAILLQDFRGSMLPPHEQRLSEEENGIVLGAMAAMHAAFWDEPASSLEKYGLCDMRTRYEGIFPAIDSLPERYGELPIVPYIREGWELFANLVPPDVADLVQALHRDVGPLCAALARYPQTLIHGDCHHGNLGILRSPNPRVILLDWTFASLGPAAADLVEYIFIGVMRLPSSKEATIDLYRRLLEIRLGSRFDDSWWQPQLDLALLGEFLRLGFDKAQTAINGPSDAIREREREEITWWCEHARRASHFL
jgi:hypothetical protein